MDYKKLQNGSDIRGVALEGIEGQHVNLTEQACKDIGRGFALWLIKKTGKTENIRVAIGRDSRLSGETLCSYICEEMVKQGLFVTDFGMASTPAMFMSTITEGYEFDGSIMVTASHLPFNRNGFKFFTANGGLEKGDIKEILQYAESDEQTNLAVGELAKGEFMDAYANILADKIRTATGEQEPLKGFKIVVDAGNGAGGFYVDKVLKPLGADTTGSRFLEPDGSFPNHIPNPENKEAMESITEAVKENKADLGIIFDTDVDRAGAVLSDGSELNRNRIIAMLSAILLREHPGTTIVTDSITSTGLKAFITEKGGVHHRFKRGYRNVINESIRLNELGQDSQLAIETSGHGALKENYFLDDGAYLVTKLLIELARGRKEGYSLASLIDTLAEPIESVEFRMNILEEDFKAYGQKVIDELNEYATKKEGWSLEENNFEGVRVNLEKEHGNGWFLLRLSLHDPLLPLNIESNEEGGAKRIALELAEFISNYDKLAFDTLIDFCGYVKKPVYENLSEKYTDYCGFYADVITTENNVVTHKILRAEKMEYLFNYLAETEAKSYIADFNGEETATINLSAEDYAEETEEKVKAPKSKLLMKKVTVFSHFINQIEKINEKTIENVSDKFMKLALEFKVDAKVVFADKFEDILPVIADGVPQETAKAVIEQVFSK